MVMMIDEHAQFFQIQLTKMVILFKKTREKMLENVFSKIFYFRVTKEIQMTSIRIFS